MGYFANLRDRNIKLSFVVMFLFVIFSTGCVFHSQDVLEVDGKFSGLKSELMNHDQALNIMIVHGMKYKPSNYAENLIRTTSERMGLGRDYNRKTQFVVRGSPNSATITLYEYRQGPKVVRFFSVWWAGITLFAKDTLDKNDKNENRLELVNTIKSGLLNDGIGDVILYHNPAYRAAINNVLSQGICRMTRRDPYANPQGKCNFSNESQAAGNSDNILAITFSLGSKILFDTVKGLAASDVVAERNAANAFRIRNSKIFMMANQLQLLGLSSIPMNINTLDGYTDSNLLQASLGDYIQARKSLLGGMLGGKAALEIIAFSDPNDFLSYRVPPMSDAKVVNIMISLAKTGYSLPFGEPQVVNPLTAHAGHEDDDDVMRMLVNGVKY